MDGHLYQNPRMNVWNYFQLPGHEFEILLCSENMSVVSKEWNHPQITAPMHAPDTGEGREKEHTSVSEGSQAVKVKNTPRWGKGRVGLSKFINNLEKVNTDSR